MKIKSKVVQTKTSDNLAGASNIFQMLIDRNLTT